MKHTRLDTLLIAGIGVLCVHELAYLGRSALVVTGGIGANHGHMPLLWGLGSALAVGGMVRAVVSTLRARRGHVDPVLLAATMAALYTSMEAAELAASATPSLSLLVDPVLWLGLLLTPVVAWTLARLVHTVMDVAARHQPARRRGESSLQSAGPYAIADAADRLLQLAHVLNRRGPPVSVVF